MQSELKILIVDDSLVYRKILIDVVKQIPDATVVGTASDGAKALKKLEQSAVDLVLLDVEMPRMDGLQTLKQIRARHPGVGAVMVSAVNQKAAEITMTALAHGAIDFVAKPRGQDIVASLTELQRALTPIVNIVNTNRILKSVSVEPMLLPLGESIIPRESHEDLSKTKELPVISLRERQPPRKFSVVAIGVSTGGPKALSELLSALSPELPIPVLVVQHMPEGFIKSLTRQLDTKSALSVREAKHGEVLNAGSVLFAPGGKHMVIKRNGRGLVVTLNDDLPVNSCRPSVDVLLKSLGGITQHAILSVMLTGMGQDGSDGVQYLEEYASYNLVQNEQTCVVYGMSKAVVEKKLADEVISLSRIAPRINELILHRGSRQ